MPLIAACPDDWLAYKANAGEEHLPSESPILFDLVQQDFGFYLQSSPGDEAYRCEADIGRLKKYRAADAFASYRGDFK